MNRNRLLLILGVLVVVLGAWWYLRAGRENVAIDLVKEFPTAKDRRPNPQAFSLVDAAINGESKRAIFTKEMQGTRIVWRETVPDNGWLKVGIGLLEDAWKIPGDGVLFSVGVSDGKTYDELLSLTVNPFTNASDRRWNDVSLDLSQYAGETVDVIFNTRAGAKGDTNGDFAVWGNPRIVIR